MRYSLLLATLAVPMCLSAQDLPQPSPKGEVEQIVGLTEVEVKYSRPSVRDRKIFGDLLPYDKLWRTGANANTTIEFDGPVKVEGQDVPAGKYSVFTIPGKDLWVVILNKNTELWGEDDYKEEEDVLRVKVKPVPTERTETLTFTFDEVKDDMARLDLRWEETRVSVMIGADATEKALANIKEKLSDPEADFRAYNASARYCVDHNIMLPEALGWAKTSVEKEKKFWNLYTLALAQAANGMYSDAIATSNESVALAQEAKYDAYVNLNKARIEEWSSKVKK